MRKASLRPDTQLGAESTIASSRPSTRNTTIKDGIIIRWENDTRPLLRRPRTSSKFLTRSECSSGGLFLSFLASMHTLFCSDVWGWHSRDHSHGSPILQLTVRKHFCDWTRKQCYHKKKCKPIWAIWAKPDQNILSTYLFSFATTYFPLGIQQIMFNTSRS